MITLGEGIHHDVPIDVYHGNCCAGPSVSASVLAEMRDGTGCPAKALAKHYLSPWDEERDDTEALAFGKAAHLYLLEGKEAFDAIYAVKPEDMSFSTKEGKAWRAEHTDKVIVTHAAMKTILRMAIGLQQNGGTANAFTEGRPEVTAVWQDRETGLWLKTRPDYLRKGLAINYKTAASAAREPFMAQAWKLGYCVGAAMCTDILEALGEPAHYAFVAQEKTLPYIAKMWVLDDTFLAGGRILYRAALRQFADCIAKGKWPGYGDDVGTLPLPPWADRYLANMGVK